MVDFGLFLIVLMVGYFNLSKNSCKMLPSRKKWDKSFE